MGGAALPRGGAIGVEGIEASAVSDDSDLRAARLRSTCLVESGLGPGRFGWAGVNGPVGRPGSKRFETERFETGRFETDAGRALGAGAVIRRHQWANGRLDQRVSAVSETTETRLSLQLMDHLAELWTRVYSSCII